MAALELAPRQRSALAGLLMFEDRPATIAPERWAMITDAAAETLDDEELAALSGELELNVRSLLAAVAQGREEGN